MEKSFEYEIVHRELRKRDLDTTAVATQLGLKYPTAYSLLHKNGFTVYQMARFSKMMEYNFFTELASRYQYPEPVDAEKTELRTKVADLEKEIEFLRRTIRDLAGK